MSFRCLIGFHKLKKIREKTLYQFHSCGYTRYEITTCKCELCNKEKDKVKRYA